MYSDPRAEEPKTGWLWLEYNSYLNCATYTDSTSNCKNFKANLNIIVHFCFHIMLYLYVLWKTKQTDLLASLFFQVFEIIFAVLLYVLSSFYT